VNENDLLSKQRAIDHHASEIDSILRSLPATEPRDHARGRLEDLLHYSREATTPAPAEPSKI
jgi:hypothetical protein